MLTKLLKPLASKTAKRIYATPTFALTTLGAMALAVGALVWSPLLLIAAVPLIFVGVGGSAIAIALEVKRKGQVWGWRGIKRALFDTKPTRWFWVSFAGHIPIFLAGLATYLFWWRKQK